MGTRHLLAAVIVSGLLTVGIATPGSADTTAATVTVTAAGVLSITVPINAGSLGTRASNATGGSVSGALGQVQVNDARGAAAGSGWIVSVTSTAFTPPTGPAIPAGLGQLRRRDDHQGAYGDLHGE